ncbi:fibronectin type III domain-containing protein [Paenibacillus sp. Marseille-P2973]|uniref:RCC1 domain-containing protein n=1 Tax=Paenibacillus sp. Marseille-P2973 TaxID=1871032 RepID=UPI001B381641|nr:fibronectin type III domain-containing protein [Paenibacillus sp. Marseille-P2973]MBQ4900933.1 fibronectin type III domain-containing protein [Paenibacillus sp. Marseille-P2973]
MAKFRTGFMAFLVTLCVFSFSLQAFGSSTYYDYGSSNHLLNKTVTSSSGEKSTLEYKYDLNGNLLKKMKVGNLDSLTNSDFEYYSGNNGVADHWEVFTTDVGLSPDYKIISSAFSGKQAQMISTNVSDGNSAGISQTISVQGGRPYILGGYYHVINLLDATAQLKVEFYNSINQLVGSQEEDLENYNQSYEHISVRGNVPVDANKAKIIISIHGLSMGGIGVIEADSMNFDYPKPVNLIAGGLYVTYALRNDGMVWGWGTHSSADYSRVPSQLPGYENIKSLAVGNQNDHLVAIKEDGTVWTYTYYNYDGEAGDGTTNGLKYSPVQAVGLTDIISIAVGRGFTLALKNDGTVWAWGDNVVGQLGDGTTTSKSTPVQVNIDHVIAVAAGDNFSVALKSDGTVWEWGSDIGGSGLRKLLLPTQNTNLNGVKAITAGYDHALVLKEDRTVWGYGRNSYGQLGNGTTISVTSPVQVSGLEATAISAGGNHSLALKPDGTVMAWGMNWNGEIGSGLDGSLREQLTPTSVFGLTGVESIAAGDKHSIAQKSDGSLWVWGDNLSGQIGTGDGKDSLIPIPVWTRGYESVPPTQPNNLVISNQTDATIALEWEPSNDNSGITGYDIYNYDTKLLRSRTNKVLIEKLVPNKNYSFTVKAVDLSGNISEPSNSVIVQTSQDIEPPSIPAKLTKSSSTLDTVTLKWEASKDNVGVTEYEVFKDGEQIAVTTQLTATMNGLSAGGTYIFTVRAKDAAGNVSEFSTPLAVTLSSDNTAPTTPTNLAGSSITVTGARLSWTKSTDTIGIIGYDIYQISDSGSEIIASSTTNSYTLNSLKPNTTYSFYVTARDNAGNQSEGSNVVKLTTKVDTTKPSTPTNLILVGTTNSSVTLKWNESTDNVGVVAYDIYEGTNLAASVTMPSGGAINLLPNTPYRFTIVARDEAGNKSSASMPLVVTIIPDIENPSAPTHLSSTEIYTNSIKLIWEVSTDNVGIVEYQIYRDDILVGTSSISEFQDLGLKSGTSYTYRVTAKDSSGNISAPSEVFIISTEDNPEEMENEDHNLLMNPEFENYTSDSSGIADGWKNEKSTGTITELKGERILNKSETMSQKITASFQNSEDYISISQEIPITTGANYYLDSLIKAEFLQKAKIELSIQFMNENREVIDNAAIEQLNPTESFVSLKQSGIVPDGTFFANVKIIVTSLESDAAVSIFLDSVNLFTN